MSIVSSLFKGSKIVDKIGDIVGEVVTDKDKRNAIVSQIALVLLQSKVAPYVRGILGITTVVSILFFGDKITLDMETQKYLLGSVYGFYFLDTLMSYLGRNKIKK